MIPTNTYWTPEDFAKKNKGIPATLAKIRWETIPGSKRINDDVLFWPGSRYPLDVWRYKIETYADRMYVLLTAINKYRYISHEELYLDKSQFDTMLENYLLAGYIKPNNLGNTYGANAYDITPDGSTFWEKLYNKKREKRAAEVDRFLDVVKKIREALPTPTITVEQ